MLVIKHKQSHSVEVPLPPLPLDGFGLRLNIMGFCPEHPKWDQNPKFTSLSETKSIPAPFIWDSPGDFSNSKTSMFVFSSAGMMIESMAGKSASLNGTVYDATPFTFSEDDPAVDYFGNLLKQCTFYVFFLSLVDHFKWVSLKRFSP